MVLVIEDRMIARDGDDIDTLSGRGGKVKYVHTGEMRICQAHELPSQSKLKSTSSYIHHLAAISPSQPG